MPLGRWITTTEAMRRSGRTRDHVLGKLWAEVGLHQMDVKAGPYTGTYSSYYWRKVRL